jgi:hypothetical protein
MGIYSHVYMGWSLLHDLWMLLCFAGHGPPWAMARYNPYPAFIPKFLLMRLA